jgi:hypothetical protein
MPGPSIFAGMTTLQMQQALTAAQKAYLELSTGSKGVTFSYTQGDGAKSVTYTQASLANLTVLIKQLQVELGILCRARRPMRFVY